MAIKVGDQVLAYIWESLCESGRHIRFGVKDQFVDGAPRVPGVSRGGAEGWLGMASTPDGVIGFA